MVIGTVSNTLPRETLCRPSILISSTSISDDAVMLKIKKNVAKSFFKLFSLYHSPLQIQTKLTLIRNLDSLMSLLVSNLMVILSLFRLK